VHAADMFPSTYSLPASARPFIYIFLPSFLFSEPSNEGDTVRGRIVDAAEATQSPFLLIAERLTGHFTT